MKSINKFDSNKFAKELSELIPDRLKDVDETNVRYSDTIFISKLPNTGININKIIELFRKYGYGLTDITEEHNYNADFGGYYHHLFIKTEYGYDTDESEFQCYNEPYIVSITDQTKIKDNYGIEVNDITKYIEISDGLKPGNIIYLHGRFGDSEEMEIDGKNYFIYNKEYRIKCLVKELTINEFEGYTILIHLQVVGVEKGVNSIKVDDSLILEGEIDKDNQGMSHWKNLYQLINGKSVLHSSNRGYSVSSSFNDGYLGIKFNINELKYYKTNDESAKKYRNLSRYRVYKYYDSYVVREVRPLIDLRYTIDGVSLIIHGYNRHVYHSTIDAYFNKNDGHLFEGTESECNEFIESKVMN